MKYMAIIDADEKPVSCEFIGCNGNVAPYRIGATTNIKALEEPCDDAISRQAVLDLVNADWKYENLESDIANLPPVTPQQKWIPVSERLPEIGQYVLCSLINAKDVKHRVIICQYKREIWWSYVVAWMPLPKPYKAESEE